MMRLLQIENEWTGVTIYNTASRTGTFSGGSTQYGSALHFGPNTSAISLTLPAAGGRQSNNGQLGSRGSHGNYWSSTVGGTSASMVFAFDSKDLFPNATVSRTPGSSIRCIAECQVIRLQ